jgi:hypothetical protein
MDVAGMRRQAVAAAGLGPQIAEAQVQQRVEQSRAAAQAATVPTEDQVRQELTQELGEAPTADQVAERMEQHQAAMPRELTAAEARQQLMQEADATEAQRQQITVEELQRRREAQAMEQYRASKEDEFRGAREDLRREGEARVGELTERGIQQRQLAADVVRGLTEGGADATQALDRMAAHLGDLPGIQGFNDRLSDPGVSPEEKARLREERRSSIVQAIDAQLEREDLPEPERKRLMMMREAAQGLMEAQKGITLPGTARRLGIAMGQTVAAGDVGAALEIAEAAKPSEGVLAPPPGADEAALKRHEEAKESAVAMQQRFLDSGKSLTEAFMTSSEDMQQLGHKGTERIQRQWEREQQIAEYAAQIGVTPAQLLSGAIPDTEEARAIRAKALETRQAYVDEWKEIEGIKETNRMPGHGERARDAAMTQQEIEIAEGMAEFATGKVFGEEAQADAAIRRERQVESVVERMLDMTSSATEKKFRESEDLRGMMREWVGEGDRPMAMARALMAREEMIEMAAQQGLIGMKGDQIVIGAEAQGEGVTRLTEEQMKTQMDKLTGNQRQAAIEALKQRRGDLGDVDREALGVLERQAADLAGIGAGKMDVADMAEMFQRFSSTERRGEGAEGGAGGEKLAMTLSGKVRIENSEWLQLMGDLSGDSDHNSMPTNVVSPA